MSITVNIYYTGKNDSARRFAEEMISRGTVAEEALSIMFLSLCPALDRRVSIALSGS